MLVISRKEAESILIGDQIEIRISEISGDRVKLAISAPKEIRITRKELLETASINREAGERLQEQTLNELKGLLKKK
ncbi:MAG: carbon storage regulator [Clostridium sp.]|uniref:carbon storage regulator n=1 Tax=Clostridium sp. TaxID=1506 RepID=UPI002906E32D|nr:carbon storage regulator [Clostridium sp.]MDU7336979.1 carbon storage regulator [Clostridium sp.]